MLLQSLLRPVLTPLMRGMFDAPIASSAAWSPIALWPDGIDSPGMWISPRDLTSEWADYTGTTPVVTPGTVADASNPVGLALDIRAGATVLTDPGNHMLQSTSAARPLMSARVNLLTYTEDADLVTETVSPNDQKNLSRALWATVSSGTIYTISHYVKANGCNYVMLSPDSGGYSSVTFDIAAGTYLRSNGAGQYVNGSALCEDAGNGWFRISAAFLTGASTFQYSLKLNRENQAVQDPNYAGDGVSGVFVWGVQYEIGTQVTSYQAILTDGSTYATDFPICKLYDGVDDGMATATFAAGTLTSAMDCMIAVRRDSAAACVAGLYNGIADATKFFGMAESASGSGCVGSGAGTPTVWVDNAQLTGGTAVTRGTLHTALTVGDYHILEFRGLDLSTWTAAGFGLYTSYVFPGARGDILLYPSTASTEDKDAARQYLADYYGVTLP
jgi:hypothetical protein